VSRQRLIVVDADLPRRLKGQLLSRGRRAIHAADLGLAEGVKDPELLRGLGELYGREVDWILVTGDDGMPAEHGPIIIETEATIATIHPEQPTDLTEHAWRIDVVQRWAHAMQAQVPQTVRRYDMAGGKVWTPRRRKIAALGWKPWRPEDAQEAEAARRHAQDPEHFPEPYPFPQKRLPGID
jgi:hypothetical protein